VYIHLEGALAQTGGDKWRCRQKKVASHSPRAAAGDTQKTGGKKRVAICVVFRLFANEPTDRQAQLMIVGVSTKEVRERVSLSAPGRKTHSSPSPPFRSLSFECACVLKTQLTVVFVGALAPLPAKAIKSSCCFNT